METRNTQTKSTKDRLDELRELCREGYVTDDEFKVARVHILKEGGVDVTRVPQPNYRRSSQEEKEESRGCGCFLITLLLAVSLILGMAYFAAPHWPQRFGGDKVMEARKWSIDKGTELIDKFYRLFSDSTPVPDPVSSSDVRPEKVPPEMTVIAPPEVPAEQPNEIN